MNYVPIESLRVFLDIGLLDMGEQPMEVGRLALINRKIYFEYAPGFAKARLELSPIKLPIKAGAQSMREAIFDGLFGVFNDSLPDGWGRLLLDRQIRSRGIPPELLGPLDRLSYVGKYGMGALIYEPTVEKLERHPDQIDLDRIAKESMKVIEGELDEVVSELFKLAGSSAGARPKIMVGVDNKRKHLIHGQQKLPAGFEHWLIKFSASGDGKDAGAIEYAYSLMAAAAQIDIMPTHLFKTKKGNGFFGVKRFDRDLDQRLHLHSLSGLIHSDHRIPSIGYELVLRATQQLTKDLRDVERAFRLSCFNVFAHNRDDHSKNFSYLMDKTGRWRFSPAYDLTFSQGPGGEHCTTIAGEGKSPGAKHLQMLARKFGIAESEATSTIDEVRAAVASWTTFADQAGVSKSSTANIAKVLKGP